MTEDVSVILPAAASTRTPKKARKWIAAEIESLDLQRDYARIWGLSTIYYADDTLVNLLYALGMPCFTQSPFGSELLMNRTRKARDQAHERANDTLSHFWRWFEYGPDHVETHRSVEQVNRIHGAMWKIVEEAFSNDDFIYTTCWLGTKLNRMRIMMGLPEWTDKQKAAAHLFWKNIMVKMRGPHGYVQGYPATFDEMNAFVDEFESRRWEPTESGHQIGQYVINQFNEARLPRAAWPIGRQMILTFQTPGIRKLHRMGDPKPWAAWMIKKALRTKIWMDENVKADPRENVAEQARRRGDTQGQHREPRMVSAAACPFRHATGISTAPIAD